MWKLNERGQDSKHNLDVYRNANGNSSDDDIISIDSAGDKLSYCSTISLDSQHTTPQDSPVATPQVIRKLKPALKLNPHDSTWIKTRQSRRRRLRTNIQAKGERVMSFVQRVKEPRVKLMCFLFVLFVAIVALVTITWKIYYEKIAQMTIGNKIRFHNVRREMSLLKENGDEMIKGILGVNIPIDLNPYQCDILGSKSDICSEWKYRARVKIHYTHKGHVSCYNIQWESLSETKFRDCINLREAHWFGLANSGNVTWPLAIQDEESKPFVTGDLHTNHFGGVLERYWLSSEGVAVIVEPGVPLFLNIKQNNSNELCLEARSEFPYNENTLPVLNYTICTGPDTKTVHKTAIKFLHRTPFNTPQLDFIIYPIWTPGSLLNTSQNLEFLQTYANNIMEHGFPPGIILMDTLGNTNIGDFHLKTDIINKTLNIFTILHLKGFKIVVPINPYVCMSSSIFLFALKKNYFMTHFGFHTPILISWNNNVCALIDVSQNSAAEWFGGEIHQFLKTFKVDGVILNGGPRNYRYNNKIANPDYYLRHYLEIAHQVSPIVGASVSFQTPNLVNTIFLSSRTSTWDAREGIKSIIPSILTYGILGYPIINIGPVGGSSRSYSDTNIRDSELYIRWLELAIFLPVLEFSFPPIFNSSIIKTAQKLIDIRSEHVIPEIINALEEYKLYGTPIIRPLWWVSPKDSQALAINDQFLVGSKILVAPVLEKGFRTRDIYLPKGWWRDELHKANPLRGGRWLPRYEVGLEEVPYFTKTDRPA